MVPCIFERENLVEISVNTLGLMKVSKKSVKEVVNEIFIGHVFHSLVTAMATIDNCFLLLRKKCFLVGWTKKSDWTKSELNVQECHETSKKSLMIVGLRLEICYHQQTSLKT